MAVSGILAQANIASDIEVRESPLQDLDGLNDRTVDVGRLGSSRVLRIGSEGNAKQDNGAKAQVDQGGQEWDKLVDTAPESSQYLSASAWYAASLIHTCTGREETQQESPRPHCP